jgi:hypothetical protein
MIYLAKTLDEKIFCLGFFNLSFHQVISQDGIESRLFYFLLPESSLVNKSWPQNLLSAKMVNWWL